MKVVKRRLMAIHRDLANQNDAIMITFWAVPEETGEVAIGLVDDTGSVGNGRKSFFESMGKALAESGVQDLWQQYADTIFTDPSIVLPQVKSREKALLPMNTNRYGEPVLNDPRATTIPDGYTPRDFMQLMFRSYVTYCFRLCSPVGGTRVKVPWAAIQKDVRAYISEDVLPDHLVPLWGESSTVPQGHCQTLLQHFFDRQQDQEDDDSPVFEFFMVPSKGGPAPRKDRAVQLPALENPRIIQGGPGITDDVLSQPPPDDMAEAEFWADDWQGTGLEDLGEEVEVQPEQTGPGWETEDSGPERVQRLVDHLSDSDSDADSDELPSPTLPHGDSTGSHPTTVIPVVQNQPDDHLTESDDDNQGMYVHLLHEADVNYNRICIPACPIASPDAQEAIPVEWANADDEVEEDRARSNHPVVCCCNISGSPGPSQDNPGV